MKIDCIFADFLGEGVLENINNSSLKTFILALKKKDKGRTFSNYGGWQSNDLSLEENVLKDLLIEIEKNLIPFEQVLRLRKEFKLKVANIWANVNGPGAMNYPHIHPGSVLSGVYYVTLPENSGNLRLINPNLFNFVSLESIGGVETFTEGPCLFTTEHTLHKSQSGGLLIFPSHLSHYVLPNLSKQKRISISFNTTVSQRE